MVLHFLLNVPIFFAQIDVLGLGRDVWITVLLLWVAGFVVAGALMVWRLSRVQTVALQPA
jgi:hypothetical protein